MWFLKGLGPFLCYNKYRNGGVNMEHSMRLRDNIFALVKNGSKTIEMRLYDEKRKLVKVGDFINFKNINTEEIVKVLVKEINVYDNFEELYKYNDKLLLGYKEEDIASPSDMNKYYSDDEQIKYGVCAIIFELV